MASVGTGTWARVETVTRTSTVTMPGARGLMQTRPLSPTPGPSRPATPTQPASLPVHPGMTKVWWSLTSLGPWAGSSQGVSSLWPLSPPYEGQPD